MDSKKDIFKSWVEYTTKNDEAYFRQFISGFVGIWAEQIELNFENAPLSSEIKSREGPALQRLPEELLPAIEKFLIISRDEVENGKAENLSEITLLMKCLTIICRHFDNIETIYKSSYVTNVIAVANRVIQGILNDKSESRPDEILLITAACHFLEALYDPYLTWRSFVRGHPADFNKLNYSVTALNPEIVPFIYYCFQSENITQYTDIGINLINVLGAIVSGSQIALLSVQTVNSFTLNNPIDDADNDLQNGLRAISPATISILILLMSKWNCSPGLRMCARNCFITMTLVLQKSSPEQRQIDLPTIFQMYINAMQELLQTNNFSTAITLDSFQIDDNIKVETGDMLDVNALTVAIEGTMGFVGSIGNKSVACAAINDAKFVSTLVEIPSKVKDWNIDLQSLAVVIVKTITYLCRCCDKIKQNVIQSNHMTTLFNGLQNLGRPSNKLIAGCLNLAFNFEKNETIVGEVAIKLVQWIPEMIEREQNYVAETLMKMCQRSLQCKQVVCEHKCIGHICLALMNHQSLSTKSILSLMGLVEELAKYNISSIEVKQLLQLLKTEMNFNYRKQLLETILKISQSRLAFGVRPTEFLDIQNDMNGITIPDIRKWDASHGFVFHIWLRLDPYDDKENTNYRRHVFSLTTSQGHGFEFFIQKNGNFVVSVVTRKETLTATVSSVQLLIGNWHSITVVVAPPKRLFSYYQVNVFLDGQQKLGSTMKFVAFHEPFIYCSIGAPFNKIRRPSNSKHVLKRMDEVNESPPPEKPKSIFPSIFERTIPGLVSQSSITSYFTLQPLKSTSSSLDPSVKPIPTGMQDTAFGELVCLKGQIGNAILADSSINLRTLFEAGPNFANIIANDLIESFDVGSRFIFCFSPTACSDGLCLDLAPGNRFNGHVMESYCRAVSIQDSINGVGGVLSLLPILDQIVTNPELYTKNDMYFYDSDEEKTPIKEINEADWEVLSNANAHDAKITKNPIACFLCLLKNFISSHELNQECILKEDAVSIIGSLLMNCRADLYDVNILMAMQLLIEAIQNDMPTANLELLRSFYRDIVFDFRIWARTQFQIIIGHIQYIQAIIKEDRKYFRKHYGVQFMLDVIQEHFVNNEYLSHSDGKTVREALFKIVKYYILKDVNIKEISILLSFFAIVKNEVVLLEALTMLNAILENKVCKDQTFILMYEPHMSELLYALLIERMYSSQVHEAVLKVIICVLGTKRIAIRHKASLRLQDMNIECRTLWPGLFSYILPLALEPSVTLTLLDQTLASDNESGYASALCLIYHLHLSDLDLKLEVARRMLTTTFIRNKSLQIFAKQVGWQESIARLLIKKPVDVTQMEKKDLVLPDMEEIVKNEAETAVTADLIVFDEESMEFKITDSLKHNKLTEAASMIENELKDLAATASEAVVDNITSVYTVIRQKTSDITDTLESLSLSGFEDNKKRTLQSMSSSDENMSFDETLTPSVPGSSMLQDNNSRDDNTSPVFKYFDQTSVDDEETLVYLVSNILFTILWRGVENTDDTWKERGQVMACINLIALNNELYCSHLSLRLRLLEMGIQATLMDLADNTHQSLVHQQNAAQLLRLTYDLVVLYPKEDESKKCSTKLLDGVLSILDSLMVFQKSGTDDWSEMIMICLGLLLKLIRNPNSDIVAMASAKLHGLLQSRNVNNVKESAYVTYSLHNVLSAAIEEGNPDHYSFLMPIMKAMLEKNKEMFELPSNTPDLPDITTGPVFFQDFQVYATTKQWTTFIEKKIKPLYQAYEKDVNDTLAEPLNTFWAECFEACKETSNKRVSLQMESRRKFNERIWLPWRVRQSEENARFGQKANFQKAKDLLTERRWHILKRYLYGKKGMWMQEEATEEFWKLSHHENMSRMRLKLEPNLYHDPHTAAANLRDNTASTSSARRLSTELGSTIAPAALGDENIDEESIQIEEEIKNNMEAQAPDVSGKEKVVIQQECELITLMMRVKGRLDVTTNQFIFTDLSQNREDGKNHDFRFGIQQVREVHLRKYNLRRSALEIFLVDQTNYFLNFTTKTRNKIYSKILSLQPPNILYGSGRSPSELLKSSGYTQKWMNREISNFEYLMHLNTIAGRSYNDLSQYPVFPWVLADYTSEELDLSKPETFRDMSKPIGVVNPKNEDEVRAKYDEFEDPSKLIPKFHYGTHYSNSAGVLHYMIRVEPFTSLHIELQSGRFDVADRQFHSIPQTWKLLMNNPNDVKELIPEFFYFPEFLKNMNKFDLGVLQNSKERVDDVVLPPWAKSAEDFINLHRKALESDYVSANLHNWIDLIFGYKQKGPRAVEALNVFYYCSYEGAVDLDKIKDEKEREAVEGMINNFGQTPSQLLREPHPKRLSIDECLTKLLRLELRRPDLTHFLDRVNSLQCDLSNDKDPIIYLSDPKSPPRSFLQTSPDLLISVTKSGILGSHSWLSYDKDKGFLLETDATTSNIKNRKRIIGPFHPTIKLSSNLFAVSSDGKYLYSGGIWDNSLRVFNTSRGKVVASVVKHFDVVTCVALDNCSSYLVTGSKDCTCIIWSLNNASIKSTASYTNSSNNDAVQSLGSHHHHQINVAINSNIFNNVPKPIHTLYGHDDVVSCVAIMTELDLVVSGSVDGTVNVYTIEEGQYVRTIQPQGCSGPKIEITYLTISYQGQIAFSALDNKSHSVHVYSINGVCLGSKYVSGRVTGLTTASDHLVVADDAGDITMHRLFGLKPVFDIPLHIPTQTVVSTAGNSHILVPLRDGSLSVVGVTHPNTKKHAVFYV